MTEHWWAIERQIVGGMADDWVEICRCDSPASVAEVIKSIVSSSKPPDVLRVRQVQAGL